MHPPTTSCRFRSPLLLILGLVPAIAGATEVPYDYLVPFTPENTIIGHYSATKKPVLTIKSGAVVRINGGGGAGPSRTSGNVADLDQWLKENDIPVTVATCPALAETMAVVASPLTTRTPKKPMGHFLVGPIYIEGAEPGDSLEVRILDVTPRIPFGTTSGAPGHGGLTLGSTTGLASGAPAPSTPAAAPTAGAAAAGSLPPGWLPRPFGKVTHLDLARNAGIFDKNIEVPLGPFMGVMGTCPADSEGPARDSSPPGAFGGNLDCAELVTGTTLYLPIFQPGALFYTGDSHAAQGDGEVTGSAIETADTCTLQFILHKGVKLEMPRAETPTDYIVFGLDTDLNKAMRQAITETFQFLKEKQGLDLFQSYTLASIAVKYRITQVVDQTLGIHGMIPKRLFINDHNTYWYRPH